MIIRSKSSFPGVVVGLDPDAVTLIAAMTTAPDAARQQLISDHIVALKAAGVWAQLDIYYVLAAHHEQASRLNWKSPGNFTLSTHGTITFTVDRGWQGNGLTGYLDTGWIQEVNAVNFTQNDASYGVYSRTNIAQNASDMGTASLITYPHIRFTDGVFYVHINQTSTTDRPSVSVSDSIGFFVGRRTGASELYGYKNGVQVSSGTSLSGTATAGETFFICARSLNNVAERFTTRQYAAAFTGAAMTVTQQANFYNAMQNGYLTAVGAAL
jgi:hypothetical protein